MYIYKITFTSPVLHKLYQQLKSVCETGYDVFMFSIAELP